ncbi:hypothetical protein BDV38DRAFT_41273 [Aspergillus pseudotamarii]|uniref:Uncharacterized protein n=1 Tax=Aspergillus pseudotamarii TaxID=132259 RepID=A0A5N6T0U6_ASPPS|nr:uncharacterized protein BDV38DRAFT_41273 [Aspergillus pseudotamarii]KAE8139870.1 hypothetical protein BDV38DRAFT_41273 [Aspergillus pseudotamarii]
MDRVHTLWVEYSIGFEVCAREWRCFGYLKTLCDWKGLVGMFLEMLKSAWIVELLMLTTVSMNEITLLLTLAMSVRLM